MPDQQRLEQSIAGLRGDPDYFREVVGNADALMAEVCRFAESRARGKRMEPWSIIGQITGHGSGVASAIYECYRERKEPTP